MNELLFFHKILIACLVIALSMIEFIELTTNRFCRLRYSAVRLFFIGLALYALRFPEVFI